MRMECVPVPSGLNIPAWCNLLADIWKAAPHLPIPVMHTAPQLPIPVMAIDIHIESFVWKEVGLVTLLGPFDHLLFHLWIPFSPMMTCLKQNS